MEPTNSDSESGKVLTLEAFADTIVPGEKRWSEDRAIAGVSVGGGAVAAGALELLEWDATGIAEALDDLVEALNKHTEVYAGEHDIGPLDESVPAFVALCYAHRSGLVAALTKPGHPEKDLWVSLALFCNMAFDSAAHLPTSEAIAAGHPGLLALGFEEPDADGFWRFPNYSYGRELADIHPDTTASGSPA